MDVRFFGASFLILPALFRHSLHALIALICLIPIGMIAQAINIMIYSNPEHPTLLSANTFDILTWSKSGDVVHAPLVNYISSYAIGLLLGYVIVNDVRLKSSSSRLIAWTISLSLTAIGFVLQDFFDVHNRAQAIVLGASLRTVISAAFAGLTYLWWLDCVTNRDANCERRSLIVRFFSWRFFSPIAKIAFSAFSVHYVFIWIETFQLRTPIEYRTLPLLSRWLAIAIASNCLGLVLYLIVEAPFMKITRDWMAAPRSKS